MAQIKRRLQIWYWEEFVKNSILVKVLSFFNTMAEFYHCLSPTGCTEMSFSLLFSSKKGFKKYFPVDEKAGPEYLNPRDSSLEPQRGKREVVNRQFQSIHQSSIVCGEHV